MVSLVSTPSPWWLIMKVSNAIFSIEEIESSAAKFHEIARLSRNIDAIDCTLIKTDLTGGDDADISRAT